jgi:hypothetical protein
MRKHTRPLVRAKSEGRKSKSRRRNTAIIFAPSVVTVAILCVGLAAMIFMANYKNEKNPGRSAYVDPPIVSKPEFAAAPPMDSLPTDAEFITGSIPPQQAVPIPLPAPKPKIAARKKQTKQEKSLFNFFTLPQNSDAQKR